MNRTEPRKLTSLSFAYEKILWPKYRLKNLESFLFQFIYDHTLIILTLQFSFFSKIFQNSLHKNITEFDKFNARFLEEQSCWSQFKKLNENFVFDCTSPNRKRRLSKCTLRPQQNDCVIYFISSPSCDNLIIALQKRIQ